ncbi:MAG: hypothetical protein AAF226_08960, partial [Verrucomicrobiota bacterium]
RKRVRQTDQSLLLRLFGQGNTKVHVSSSSPLRYQPAIDALTGYGPLKAEPASVMKDPDRQPWNSASSAIRTFHNQLTERGVQLVIVPIPVKPMVSPAPVSHADEAEFYQQLRSEGIQVIDLKPHFTADSFLNQDTHWTAAAAERSAQLVADQLSEFKGPLRTETEIVQRSHMGDLVGMLDLRDPSQYFSPELQTLKRVIDPETSQPLADSLESPIALIGDSFLNIYEEPGLGFGIQESESALDQSPLIGAGVPSHLAAALGTRLQVIAINGEGATGVRQAFAQLPDNIVRSKKVVIWALASRDLLLAESAAGRAGVRWGDVTFNPTSDASAAETAEVSPSDQTGILMAATLSHKSAITDPEATPYKDAIYSTVFTEVDVFDGDYGEQAIFTFLWAFRDRKLQPDARLEEANATKSASSHSPRLQQFSE